jgi:hypothetical protein
MTDRELMQMALEAVEYFYGGGQTQVNGLKLIEALRDRLAQPEPEPVLEEPKFWVSTGMGHTKPLYTAPPKREWVGLTGLEQKELMAMNSRYAVFETEAKLKEKNT